MASSTLHLAEVDGYAGPARCYELSKPHDFGGAIARYATVWLQPAMPHMDARVVLVAATETGASAERSLRERPGSFTPHFHPATPEQIDGAFAWALATLGYPVVAE